MPQSPNHAAGSVPAPSSPSSRDSLRCPLGESECYYLDELDQLRQRVEQLSHQVRTDALTKLYNYRHFVEALAMEMERTRRTGQPLSLALVDIDHFKRINDDHGHETGNRILAGVADRLRESLRKLDLPCRFGGEEFALILPNTGLRQSLTVAERVRQSVAERAFCKADGTTLPVTVSVGVDVYETLHPESVEAYLHRVDQWMYRAKAAGRNRIAHPAPPEYSQDTSAVTSDERDALFR